MMKRTGLVVAVVAVCVACFVHADYSVRDHGAWPKSWPAELDGLRKQARTLEGPLVPQLHYEIPFKTREEFEAAWPHLLKVKSKGAPVFLVRGPRQLYDLKAGVIVHTPPADTDKAAHPEVPPARERQGDRGAWMWMSYIELVVDGEIVDLNRIPLPSETPIIDERFREQKK